MTRLKDIAEELKISVSTVSRVVNQKDRVDPETRKRVLQTLRRVNYRPNDAARSLRKQSTNAIGLIIPDIANTFFANMIKGLETVVRKKKHTLLLCNSDEDANREEESLDLLFHKQVAGLVLTTVSEKDDYIDEYREAGVPVIFVDNLPQTEKNFDYVIIDNVKASYELIMHLIRMGHKDIGIIAGPFSETSGAETFEGWKKAMTENHLEMYSKWIGKGNFQLDSGYEQMQRILSQMKRPTAVFAANNQMAYGAVRAISEFGLKVPDDIAVVTFSTGDPTGMIHPELTAIIEPAEEMGRIAGEILFRKLANPDRKAFERIVLEPQLHIGESCGYHQRMPKGA